MSSELAMSILGVGLADQILQRRKAAEAERARRDRERRESLSIYTDGRHPRLTPGDFISGRPLWRRLDVAAAEAAARKAFEALHAGDIVPAPEPEGWVEF